MSPQLIEYFALVCTGVSALGITCGAVYWTVKQTMAPLAVEVNNLKQRFDTLDQDKHDSENRLERKIDALALKIDQLLVQVPTEYMKKADCERQRAHCEKKFDKMS